MSTAGPRPENDELPSCGTCCGLHEDQTVEAEVPYSDSPSKAHLENLPGVESALLVHGDGVAYIDGYGPRNPGTLRYCAYMRGREGHKVRFSVLVDDGSDGWGALQREYERLGVEAHLNRMTLEDYCWEPCVYCAELAEYRAKKGPPYPPGTRIEHDGKYFSIFPPYPPGLDGKYPAETSS